MKLIINTAVFADDINAGKSQLEVLKRFSDLKIKVTGIQVRQEMFHGNWEGELRQIRKLCDQNNWNLFLSIPQGLLEKGRLNAGIRTAVKLADRFKVDELKFSCGNLRQLTDHIIRQIQEIDLKQIAFDIENEPNPNGRLPVIKQGLEKLRATNIGFCFDSGNWRWISENSDRAFDELYDFIHVFHLKNIKHKQTVPLNQPGEYDWRSMINACGNQIPVVVEYAIPWENLRTELANLKY